jgi:hypothetical protein
MNTNLKPKQITNPPLKRIAFIPLASANTFTLLPDKVRASYQRFCQERIQELQADEVIILAGLEAFYADIISSLN